MKNIIKSLTFVILGIALFTSCKKEEIVINNYQLVEINFNPNEVLNVVQGSLFKSASVTKTQATSLEFPVVTPSTYYAYFIVDGQVIHKFDNIVKGSQPIQIQNRKYDNIIVSSIPLEGTQALGKYNNATEYSNKLLYSLPSSSANLILAGQVIDHDVRQNKNITVTVKNVYAAVLFFNVSEISGQNNAIFTSKTTNNVNYLYSFIKSINSTSFTDTWTQGFAYKVANKTFNATHTLKSNNLYRFYVDANSAELVDGNFTVIEDELYVLKHDVTLPGM